MTELKDQARHGVRWTALGSFASVSSHFLMLLVLARYFLTPAEFGLASLTLIYSGIAAVLMDLGLSQALIHHRDASREEISSVFWISIPIGATLFLVSLFLAPLVAVWFSAPELAPLIQVLSIQFLFLPASRQFEALLSRDFAFRMLSWVEVSSAIALLTSAVVVAALGFGVWAIIISALIAAAVRATILFAIGLRRYPLIMRLRLSDIGRFVRFSVFQFGSGFVSLVGQRIDQLLLGWLIGLEALGLYNVAYQAAAQPVYRINVILTRVSFPVFAHVQTDTPRLRRGYLEVCEILAAINAPILLGLVAIAPVALPLVLGEQWAPAITAFQLLCIVGLLRSMGNPVGSLLMAKGRTDLGFYWNVVLFFAVIPFLLVGAYWGGLTGVAAALAAFQIILFLPNYLFLVRPLIGSCAPAYFAAILRPILVAAIMAVLVSLVSRIALPHAWVALALQVVFGVVFYVIAILVLRPSIALNIVAALPPGRASARLRTLIDKFPFLDTSYRA